MKREVVAAATRVARFARTRDLCRSCGKALEPPRQEDVRVLCHAIKEMQQ